MKIILIGNIGVGKTTIANLLLKNHEKADYLSIDNIRNQFGDGTMEKEKLCKNKFINASKVTSVLQIIELTGVGVLGERLFKFLNKVKVPVLVVHLVANHKVVLKRATFKQSTTPFPLPLDNIPTAIKYTQDRFEEGLSYSLMKKCPRAIFITLENANEALLNRNLLIILSNIELVKLFPNV